MTVKLPEILNFWGILKQRKTTFKNAHTESITQLLLFKEMQMSRKRKGLLQWLSPFFHLKLNFFVFLKEQQYTEMAHKAKMLRNETEEERETEGNQSTENQEDKQEEVKKIHEVGNINNIPE